MNWASRYVGRDALPFEDPIENPLHHRNRSFRSRNIVPNSLPDGPIDRDSVVMPFAAGDVAGASVRGIVYKCDLQLCERERGGLAARMVDDIISALTARYGQGWIEDTDANIRFAIEAERLVGDLADAHLIGEPELDEHTITLQFWVDRPIADLMSADEVAFSIFARISIEIFYAERRFVEGAIVYPFVTGTARHGHSGSVVLAGPHAAEFSERFRQRLIGGPRFHA